MIELKNVFFKYKDEEVLKNINLKIGQGDSIALIGANGSGKSTLLKLLNGIIFPSSGDYYFNNVLISKDKLEQSDFSKKFHKKMGFVFQNSDAQLLFKCI